MGEIIDLPIKQCRECGAQFRQRRADQIFCCSGHKAHWHRRAQVRGGQAYSLLMDWRKTRGGRAGVLSDIAHIVDGWIREDAQKEER